MTERNPFLEPGSVLSARLVGEMLGRDQAAMPPGTSFGPFRTLGELGRGGLGVVYLAERADGAFEQQVALKVIRPDGETGLAEALLARERRILARLRHPGIAHIIDGGRANDVIWFAMEYVEGERIDHYCRDHGLDGRARLTLLRKVGEAVAYAHAHLVVHRDIKPANILVDDSGQPRLLDFGIAAVLDEAERDDPAQSAATPGFASPEQSRGETTGIAADVYQLGRLLDILMKDAHVSDRRGLDAVRHKALHDYVEERYPNVEVFNADLRALLAGRPVSACEHRRGYRSRLFLRRHRLGTLATAAGTVAFLVTVGYFLWSLDAARQHAEREAATARRVSEFMISVFEGADPWVHQGRKPTVDELLARGRERIETELANESRVKGALLAALGRIYFRLDEPDLARSMLEQAVALGDADSMLPAGELAERKVELARIFAVRRDFAQSRGQLSEALDLLAGKEAQAALQNSAFIGLSTVDCFEGNLEESMDRLSASIEHARRMGQEDSLAFAENLYYLGTYMDGMERHKEAFPLISEAYGRMQALRGENHPITLIFGMSYAVQLAEIGAAEAARSQSEDSLVRTINIYGEQSHRAALALGMKGRVTYLIGDIKAAIREYEEAIEIGNKLPAHGDLDSISILEDLGDAYAELNQWEAAQYAYAEMISRIADGRQSMRADVGQRSLKLARALAMLGHCEEADRYWTRARDIAANVSPRIRIHTALAEPLPGCAEI